MTPPGVPIVVVTPLPTCTLHFVAAARRAGDSRWNILRFYGLHLILSPLTIASRSGVSPARIRRIVAQMTAQEEIHGVSIAGRLTA